MHLPAILLSLALTQAPAPDAAAAPAPPAGSEWRGALGAGLIWLTGNSRSVTSTLEASAERKGHGWIFGGKVSGKYGTSHPAGSEAEQVVAQAAAAQLRVDRRLGTRHSAYVLGTVETDHVNSVELRNAGELGATAVWIDRGTKEDWNLYLRNDAGFRVTRERRFQYHPLERDLPDETLFSPRLGLAFRYQPWNGLTFTQDAELLSALEESRVRVNGVTKLSSRIVASLSLAITYSVAYDSAPAPGKVETDTTLAVTLEVKL